MRGADKLLEPINGLPLLRVMALRGLEICDKVLVALPAEIGPRDDALSGLDVEKIHVKNASDGLSASLKAGIRALPATASAVIILPADMPDIQSADLTVLLVAHRKNPEAAVIRAQTETGDAGHPILFTQACFAEFDALSGDKGAAKLAVDALLVPLSGKRARRDLDTPEDWLAWRRDSGIFS